MRLCDINLVEGFNVNIYGALNYKCFSVKCTANEFKDLKKTGVLISEVFIYDKLVLIECNVNAKRSQDLISKAISMGIQITYYSMEF